MTLVVCPNLAVDRVLTAETVCLGGLTRCRALRQQAGGKGANVLRALHLLRGGCGAVHGLLAGFAAGQTGSLFAELAADEGLATHLIACAGDMRVSTVLLAGDGSVTRLFEHGPEINARDETALLSAMAARPAEPGEWAIVDGAAPPGASKDFYGTICRTLRIAGYRVLVDATGVQLIAGLSAGPDFVKVNFAEACSAVGAPRGVCADGERPSGKELEEEGQELSRLLVAAGAQDAVVTLGAAGAVGLIDDQVWRVQTPPIEARNAVGSGDCFAAGLVVGFERGEPPETALASAAGAAAANAASRLTGHFDLESAYRLTSLATVDPRAH